MQSVLNITTMQSVFNVSFWIWIDRNSFEID